MTVWNAAFARGILMLAAGKALPFPPRRSDQREVKPMCESKPPFPTVESQLRHNILKIPPEVYSASGIRHQRPPHQDALCSPRTWRSSATATRTRYSPFIPSRPSRPSATPSSKPSYIPVFCGVGGGTTKGLRTVWIWPRTWRCQGAMGVVLNAPISDLNLAGGGQRPWIFRSLSPSSAPIRISSARLRAGACHP